MNIEYQIFNFPSIDDMFKDGIFMPQYLKIYLSFTEKQLKLQILILFSQNTLK